MLVQLKLSLFLENFQEFLVANVELEVDRGMSVKMNRMRLPPATNPSVVFVLVYKKCLHNFRPSIRPSTHNKGPIAMKRVPREFPHIIPLNGSLCELHKGWSSTKR